MEDSPGLVAAGQVCDRCRLKKIKCDGTFPSCRNCSSSGASCVVSAKLRRKTKARGFQTDGEALVQRLQAENAALSQRLQHEEARSRTLQRRVDEVSHAHSTHRNQPRPDAARQPDSVSADSQASGRDKSARIIKHMGRLVCDGEGVERFAGSTTGVHFILSVQQFLCSRGISRDRFPENCFRLHLLQRKDRRLFDSPKVIPAAQDGGVIHGLRLAFRHATSIYTRHVDAFVETWSGICPVLARSDLKSAISSMIPNIQAGLSVDTTHGSSLWPTCFHLAMVLLINDLNDDSDDMSLEEHQQYLDLAGGMIPQLVATADIPSIQGLSLLSLYILLSGQTLAMPQVNGFLVQAGQMAGLHRHSRRFKFSAGQVEMRKRIWWWIYVFDKFTALTLGLPQLIQDDDVDVDYPVDCELEHAEADSLAFPLPGETTSANDFVSLAHLSRILAAILGKLYTTTKRRDGDDKIVKLHHDLQAWKRRFPSSLAFAGTGGGNDAARVWLLLMYQLAVLIVFRPGLTFDEETPQFRSSLQHCYEASTEIIRLISLHAADRDILGMAPLGPSLTFQCGLMQIYYHAHTPTELPNSGQQVSGEATVDAARNILLSYLGPRHAKVSLAADLEVDSFADAIEEATQLLQSVGSCRKHSPEQQEGSRFACDRERSSMPTPALSLDPLEGQPFSPSLPPGLGSLEDLNQLDYLDWMFDGPFDAMASLGQTPGN